MNPTLRKNNKTVLVLVAICLNLLSYAPNKIWAHPIDDESLSTLASINSEDEDSQQSDQDFSNQQEEQQSYNSSMIKPSHERPPNVNTTDDLSSMNATERSTLIPSREKPSLDTSEQPVQQITTTENLTTEDESTGKPVVTSNIHKSPSSFQTTEQPVVASSARPIISTTAQPMVFVPVQPVVPERPVVYVTQRPNMIAHVVQAAPVYTHQYPQTTGFLGTLKNMLVGFLKFFFPFALS